MTHKNSHAIIGIDAGTTAIKAVAFAPDGTVLGSARRQVEVLRNSALASESDMEDIWLTTLEVLREVFHSVRDREIIGIGVTGQGDGAWFVDERGNPANQRCCGTTDAARTLSMSGNARVKTRRSAPRRAHRSTPEPYLPFGSI